MGDLHDAEIEQLRAHLDAAVALLEDEANLLDAWARESQAGGWSTHQVDSQRRRADELRRKASQWRRQRVGVSELSAAGYTFDRVAHSWSKSLPGKRTAYVGEAGGCWTWRISEHRAIGGSAVVALGPAGDVGGALQAVERFIELGGGR